MKALVRSSGRRGRPQTHKDILEPFLDALLARYESGESLRSVAETMGIPLSVMQIRSVLATHYPGRWDESIVERAHQYVERMSDMAECAARLNDSGGFRTAIDTYHKLAAVHAPKIYSDKRRVELSGIDGAPIRTEANVTLTPDEAYKRMLRGDE